MRNDELFSASFSTTSSKHKYTKDINTETSIKGLITPVNASFELTPQTCPLAPQSKLNFSRRNR
jgi:hypothetical protein